MVLDCCNIQDGALYDNSSRLEVVNYYNKELHLGCCSNPRSASAFVTLKKKIARHERVQKSQICLSNEGERIL